MRSAATIFDASEGYLELGLIKEAMDELEKLVGDDRTKPSVSVLRWRIFSAAKEWGSALDVAKQLVSLVPQEPVYWVWAAISARQAESLTAAVLLLRVARLCHSDSPLVQYRLACYEAQSGHFVAASECLRSALQLMPSLQQTALQEQDLQPLWATRSKRAKT